MNFAQAGKLKELEQRIQALERERSPIARSNSVLSAQAAAMHEQGDALKTEIRTILEGYQGTRHLKAFAVLTLLKRTPAPSLRRVQEVMREIKREADGTAPLSLAHGESHN